MKKKIIGVALVAAIAIAASWNFNQSKNGMTMSDLALANVDALARWEDGSNYHLFPCPSSSGNECRFKDSDRPVCHSATYCN